MPHYFQKYLRTHISALSPHSHPTLPCPLQNPCSQVRELRCEYTEQLENRQRLVHAGQATHCSRRRKTGGHGWGFGSSQGAGWPAWWRARLPEAPTGQTTPPPPSAGSTSVASAAGPPCSAFRQTRVFLYSLILTLSSRSPWTQAKSAPCPVRGREKVLTKHLLFLLPQSTVTGGCQERSRRALSCPDK